MTVVADSSGLFALYDRRDPRHEEVRSFVEALRAPLVVPAALLAEIDYMLREFLSPRAEIDFLASLRDGLFTLAPLLAVDLERCLELLERYRDLDLGLADASVVATAERLATDQILTLDQRHFRTLTSRRGRPFVLLPSDTPGFVAAGRSGQRDTAQRHEELLFLETAAVSPRKPRRRRRR